MTNPFAIVVKITKSSIVDEQQNCLHAVLSGKMRQACSLRNGGNRSAVLRLAEGSIRDEQ